MTYHDIIQERITSLVASLNMYFLNILEDENIEITGDEHLKDLVLLEEQIHEMNRQAFTEIN